MLNQLKIWPFQHQRFDQIGPMSHMGPGLKKWLVQYLRLDQIGPMSYMGPGPISDIGPGPMWHMGLAYYWQVRALAMGGLTYETIYLFNIACLREHNLAL